jgi:hypothetical protein
MSTKLKRSLYIDDDIKLIYRDSMYKIFVDDHCAKYEIYDSGNSVTGYIRLFVLNKTIEYIKIINDVFIEIDRNNNFIYIDRDNIRNEDHLIQLLEYEEVKEAVYDYINQEAGY